MNDIYIYMYTVSNIYIHYVDTMCIHAINTYMLSITYILYIYVPLHRNYSYIPYGHIYIFIKKLYACIYTHYIWDP